MKFDFILFGRTLNSRIFSKQIEINRRIGFRELSKETNVSISTISRATRGNKLDIDSVLNLLEWMQIDIKCFIKK